MSFSEFYQRSINEPGVLGRAGPAYRQRRPLRQRWIIAAHRFALVCGGTTNNNRLR